ncbi:MAG: cell division FtsZ family protein [Candidatus Riflebacteria bacterium]|nr:cell division FtsZ family protein [Candidatus Riflebacteria bacterium]
MESAIVFPVKKKKRISIVGVGKIGISAVNQLIDNGLKGVRFIAVSTELHAPAMSKTRSRLVLPTLVSVTSDNAEEARSKISHALRGSDLVIIVAGMGCVAETIPILSVADAARYIDVLTIGVVTRPFSCEGRNRVKEADSAINTLLKSIDAVITIPNDMLIKATAYRRLSMAEANDRAEAILVNTVRCLSDLFIEPSIINVDFSDFSAIMKGAGLCRIGVGYADGKNRAGVAGKASALCPLLEQGISNSRKLIVIISVNPDIMPCEIRDGLKAVTDMTDPDASILPGVLFDDYLPLETMKITIFAAGFV